VPVGAQAERLQMNWLAKCNTYFILFHKICEQAVPSVSLRLPNSPACQGRWGSLLLSHQMWGRPTCQRPRSQEIKRIRKKNNQNLHKGRLVSRGKIIQRVSTSSVLRLPDSLKGWATTAAAGSRKLHGYQTAAEFLSDEPQQTEFASAHFC